MTNHLRLNVCQSFAKAARMLSDAHLRAETRAKATHERFNVFTTLLKSTDEVRLHTRILHSLLDPNGLHDCGDQFLNLFLETLKDCPGLDQNGILCPLRIPDSILPWSIQKEASRAGFGKMDLLLERRDYGIAIENKIHAHEQHRQIASYSDYLSDRYGKSATILYLTLDGKPSDTSEGKDYLRISYREHVLTWLEKCLRASYRIIPVNQVLLQYQNTVKTLTGHIMSPELITPVADFISLNPDLVRYRQQLDQAVDEAKASFMDRLAEGIVQSLRIEMKAVLHPENKGGRFGLDSHGGIYLDALGDEALLPHPFTLYIEHDTDDQVLALGVWFDQNDVQYKTEHLAWKQRMEDVIALDPKAKALCDDENEPNDGWPFGWICLLSGLDDKGFADAMEKSFPVLLEELCARIREYFSLLKGVASKVTAV